VGDAGGGLAAWSVSVAVQSAPTGVTVTPGAATVAPGTTLDVTAAASRTSSEGDATGFVVLSRDGTSRRVPFWLHVEVPKLAGDPHRTLPGPGLYRGDTRGKQARVDSYRWPERGYAGGVPTSLAGPEQVFRFTLRRRVANVGVVVLTHAAGTRVSPRLVHAGDENRLVGIEGLPAMVNPYAGLPRAYPVVGAVLPLPGTYDVVFDTPTGAAPGRFLFRLWVDDTTPPRIRLLHSSVRAGEPIRLTVRDAGSGVDPQSLVTTRDGAQVPFRYAHGVVSLETTTLPPGTHRIVLTASDYQEAKNTEDVGPVRPNTRVFRATVTVRP
jgi:hypothetical protein